MESPRSQKRRSPTNRDHRRPRHDSGRTRHRSPRPRRDDDEEEGRRRHAPSDDGQGLREGSRERRRPRPQLVERMSSERSKRKRSPRGDREEDRGAERRRRREGGEARRLAQPPSSTPAELPLGARKLVKGDFEAFRPLLAYYLRIQKQRDASRMDERELRGRWKSFMGKWNAGELAEGWYDPSIWEAARAAEREGFGDDDEGELEEEEDQRTRARGGSYGYGRGGDDDGDAGRERSYDGGRRRSADDFDDKRGDNNNNNRRAGDDGAGSDSDSDIGPAPPPSYFGGISGNVRHTAATPGLEDLKLRDELVAEESAQERADRVAQIRQARKEDRREQKERLEELVPRADPGSRERKLEKKREVNDKMREFRERSPGGEVDEGTLMGAGEEGSLEAAKRAREGQEKKKSEREARREEIWRARMAEREERVREYKEREEGTIEMLKELARSSGRSAI